MKIRCQACGSRFKIADEKIPDQGAVLPCPKCKAKISINKQGAEPNRTLDAIPAMPNQPVAREAVPPVQAPVADDPFAMGEAPAPQGGSTDPFGNAQAPAADDPFAMGEAPAPQGGSTDPFGNAQAPVADDPFAMGEAPAPQGGSTDPFGNAQAPVADDPFAMGEAPAPQGGSTDPFGNAQAPAEDFTGSESDEIDTFAIDPFGDDFSASKKTQEAPLDQPFSDPFANQDPFGNAAAPQGGSTDPFGAPPAMASDNALDDPFAQGLGGSGAPDLFSSPGEASVPAPDAGQNPFGMAPPAKAGETATDDLFGMDATDSFDFKMDADPTPAAPPTPSAPIASSDDSMVDQLMNNDPLQFQQEMGEMGDAFSGPSAGKDLSVDPGLLNDIPVGGDATTKATRLFHVRRANGKVFGPFPISQIVEMLENGKLHGNEEVSAQEGMWLPIGEIPEFKKAAKAAMNRDVEAAPAEPGMEREVLAKEKNRIAELSKARRKPGSLDVQSGVKRAPVNTNIRRVVPFAVGGLILAVYIYLEFVMGVGLLFSNSGRPLDEQVSGSMRKKVEEVREDIIQDTYVSYRHARDTLMSMMKKGKFRGHVLIKAMLVTTNYALANRFGEALPPDTATHVKVVESYTSEHEEPEVVYAKAASLKSQGKWEEAKKILTKLSIKLGTDARVTHQLAEIGLALKDTDAALKLLDRLSAAKKDTAQTMYLKGLLYSQVDKKDDAIKALQTSLAKDPNHLDSRIELAGLLAKAKETGEEAEKMLSLLLIEQKENLSKQQMARIHYYNASLFETRGEAYKVVKELLAAIENDANNRSYYAKLAAFYHEKHEYDKARDQFQKCLKLNPKDVSCHVGLAEVFLELNQPDQSLFELEEAKKEDENNPRIHYLLGQSMEGLNKPEQALQHYERAIAADREGVLYYAATAMLYLKMKNVEKAAQYIQDAKSVDEKSPLVFNALGIFNLTQKDQQAAEEMFRQAIQADPAYAEAHFNLADAYRKVEKFDEAIAEYRQVLELDERNAKSYLGLGQTFLAKANKLQKIDPRGLRKQELVELYEKASKEFGRAVELNKSNANYLYHLGMSQFLLEQYPKALENLRLSLNSTSGNHQAAFYLCRVYFAQRDFARAREFIETAIQIEPKKGRYYYWLGRCLDATDRLVPAAENYKEALTNNPNLAEAHVYLGIVYRKQNRYVQAIQSITKGMKLNPNLTVARVELGDCYLEMRKFPQAIKEYKGALKEEPENIHVLMQLGTALTERRKYSEAIATIEKAISLDPERAEAYEKLGYLYKIRNKTSKAREAFEKFMELAPDSPNREDVQKLLDYL